MINLFKNIHPKVRLMLGFAMAIMVYLVLEPYPIYLAHSFQSFELITLGIGVLTVICIIVYSRIEIKNDILDFSVIFVLLTSSLCILGILIAFATYLIMYHVIGMNYLNEIIYADSFILVSLLVALVVSVYVPIGKEHWPILVGSLLPCPVALVWALIKLHH